MLIASHKDSIKFQNSKIRASSPISKLKNDSEIFASFFFFVTHAQTDKQVPIKQVPTEQVPTEQAARFRLHRKRSKRAGLFHPALKFPRLKFRVNNVQVHDSGMNRTRRLEAPITFGMGTAPVYEK